MVISDVEEIKAWQLARELVNSVYEVIKNDKFKRDYSLKDQICRAATSVMLNIAEGFDSGTNKSFISFLKYSYRSASEVNTVLYIALDQKYISRDQFQELKLKTSTVKKVIGGLIQYLLRYESSKKTKKPTKN